MNKNKNQTHKIKLIAGLGNPEEAYGNTYHNIGAKAVDWLVGRFMECEAEFKAQAGVFAYAKTGGYVWIKPLVFMNESGMAIEAACGYFKISPEEIAVMHDDSDLPLGAFKFSVGSGSAGHRGVESIIKRLGTKNFLRIRIGIRGEEKARRKARDLVLKRIQESDRETLEEVFKKIFRAAEEKKLL